jgi:hypothetical protein
MEGRKYEEGETVIIWINRWKMGGWINERTSCNTSNKINGC